MSVGNTLDTTRTVLKSLVLTSPQPLTIAQLSREYEDLEGKPIPFETLGYRNLRSFLLSMTDILAYDSVKRTFTLAAGEGGNSEHIHRLVSGQRPRKNRSNNSYSSKANHSNRPNNSNHGNNNGQFREQHTFQIWDQHPLNFNQQQNSQPNGCMNGYPPYQPRQFGPGNLLNPPSYSLLGDHPSVSHLIPNLPIGPLRSLLSMKVQPRYGSKNFHKPKNETVKKRSNSTPLVDDEKTGSKKQIENADTLNGNQSDLCSAEVEALPPIDEDDAIRYIGTKTMSSKYGRNIPRATMPKTLGTGHIHQVCVTEVTRFPHFYFQFAGTDDTMRELQDELESDHRPTEKIRPSEIQIGNACAAWYANKWSRAEMLSLPDDSDRVKLLFVDYGTIDYVSIDNIRHLYREICDIPRLCHRGTLAFLEPSRNDQVEQKIIKMFCKMVADKSLIAVVSNVDESDDISMTLVDTNDPKVDLIVNKILMENIDEIEHQSDNELDVLK